MPQTKTRHTPSRTNPESHKSIPQKSHKRTKHHDSSTPNQRSRLDNNHRLLRKILRTIRLAHENRHQIRNPRLHHQRSPTPRQPRNTPPNPSQRHSRSKTNKNRRTILRGNSAKPKRNQEKRRNRPQFRLRTRTNNRKHNTQTSQHHPKLSKRKTENREKMKQPPLKQQQGYCETRH